jgi:hypothetical protein
MDYSITNVKVSVKCSSICLDTVVKKAQENNLNYKLYSNYLVIQYKYTYVIFKQSLKSLQKKCHVNITKIPNLFEIDNAKKLLQTVIPDVYFFSTTVDNITVSTNINRQYLPTKIISLFSDVCKITFNQETFPGVFLKFSNGTAILFHTGKCILIGCKTIENIEKILCMLQTVINNDS